jgi:hypothetical protein
MGSKKRPVKGALVKIGLRVIWSQLEYTLNLHSAPLPARAVVIPRSFNSASIWRRSPLRLPYVFDDRNHVRRPLGRLLRALLGAQFASLAGDAAQHSAETVRRPSTRTLPSVVGIQNSTLL